MALITQLVRVTVCGSVGHEFESRLVPNYNFRERWLSGQKR